MPCMGGPSYVSTDELNEVKLVCDKLKKEVDLATRLLCQFGPLLPQNLRTDELNNWLDNHASQDKIRAIDEKIAKLNKAKEELLKNKKTK